MSTKTKRQSSRWLSTRSKVSSLAGRYVWHRCKCVACRNAAR